ncbi:MAG TPA: hypothetical protein VN766_12615 [Stellaceae bacterium]|jgi:hypothetical protein|nr:hypothetical protein [Stellaceae bacterium]
MVWLRALIPLTIPFAVIAALWVVPVPPDAAAAGDGATVLVGRSIGLGLLTLAFLAIAFVVFTLRIQAEPAREPAPMALARHEFRRGFATGEEPRVMRRPAPAAAAAAIVVALPRQPIAFAGRAAASAAAPIPHVPQDSIESLIKRLHERAGVLWPGRSAKRA